MKELRQLMYWLDVREPGGDSSAQIWQFTLTILFLIFGYGYICIAIMQQWMPKLKIITLYLFIFIFIIMHHIFPQVYPFHTGIAI